MKYVLPILVLVVVLVTILVDEPVIYYLFNIYEKVLNSSDISSWGAFGDFFGGIFNPIFSFISIILIIYTVIQQGKAIEQTSTQIELSMKEVAKSVEAQEEQVKLNRNQFDYVTKQAVINEVYTLLKYTCSDLDQQLAQELPCFKDVTEKRQLKEQLIEVREKNGRASQEFLDEYSAEYSQYKSLVSFLELQIMRLKDLGDIEGKKYFDEKLKIYKGLNIQNKAQLNDLSRKA